MVLLELGFPDGLAGKESACNVGDLGLIPGFRRPPGEGHGYPVQYCGLENFMGCIESDRTERLLKKMIGGRQVGEGKI